MIRDEFYWRDKAEHERRIEFDRLTERLRHVRIMRQTVERRLFAIKPQTGNSNLLYAKMVGLEAEERELRAFIDKHPNKSYDGL